ncbi:MAG: presenilin family intramembrane aspartyl protease [Candidatus Altiarchaeota archaeon]
MAKKKEISPVLYIIVLYVVVMGLGLYVSTKIITKIYETGELMPAVSNPAAPESSAEIFIYILVMTAVLLLLIKLKLDWLIRVVALFAVFVGMTLATTSLIGDTLGILLSLTLMALSLWQKQNIFLLNLTLIATVTGIGAFLGASLTTLPSILLLIALSIYDLVAVFWTKHMVTLAEKAKGKLPFMFIIPHQGRNVGLGTGDLAIPLTFTVSVYKDYAMLNALTTAAGGLIAIILLFHYIQHKKRITLPALPPLAVGLAAGYFISLLPTLI